MGKEGRRWKTKDKRRHRGMWIWQDGGPPVKEIGAEETRLWRVGQIFIKKILRERQDDGKL